MPRQLFLAPPVNNTANKIATTKSKALARHIPRNPGRTGWTQKNKHIQL